MTNLRMECLKLAANITCSNQKMGKDGIGSAQVVAMADAFYDFVVSDRDEPKQEVQYIGTPRSKTAA